ncbi:MAG TPA: outer membrane protein assembly factor BamD [Terriglobia bacterium]|nr:outer membrane protein assembly factor BamD [Terriglobia bacterium]
MRSKAAKSFLLAILLLALSACGFRRHALDTPLISDSQQPDKELFDRATDFLEHSRFTEARLLLQTLINTYPDSEYLAKSKLAIADSWYRQGTASDLAQAELEYRDFITFFPTMPEAAEAQMRVAMIHYRGMEKPDRDPLHARRAEQEFQRVILNYPDGPFTPLAEQRLREVQEVLAHGQFEVGRFYFLQMADRAAQPRLKELVERYPNYSQAPEALLLLGRSIERSKGSEGSEEAAGYYSRIVRDYPLSEQAEAAKERLTLLGFPVPEPDPAAVARMTYEKAHAVSPGLWSSLLGGFRRRPDVSAAQGRLSPPTMTPQGPAQPGAISSFPLTPASPAGGGAASSGITLESVPAPNASSRP